MSDDRPGLGADSECYTCLMAVSHATTTRGAVIDLLVFIFFCDLWIPVSHVFLLFFAFPLPL